MASGSSEQLHQISAILQDWGSVKTRLRILKVGKDSYGYSEFSGIGAPPATHGSVGDIYLDLRPGALTLYGRYPDEWKKWCGPQSWQDILPHPIHNDRCLWCNDTFGWLSRRSIKLHPDKTQDSVLANSTNYRDHLKRGRKRIESVDLGEANPSIQKKSRTWSGGYPPDSLSSAASQISQETFNSNSRNIQTPQRGMISPNNAQLGLQSTDPVSVTSSTQWASTTYPLPSTKTHSFTTLSRAPGSELPLHAVTVSPMMGPRDIVVTNAPIRKFCGGPERANQTTTGDGNLLSELNRLKASAAAGLEHLRKAQEEIDRLKQENESLKLKLMQSSAYDVQANERQIRDSMELSGEASLAPTYPNRQAEIQTEAASPMVHRLSKERTANDEEYQTELSNSSNPISANSAKNLRAVMPGDDVPVLKTLPPDRGRSGSPFQVPSDLLPKDVPATTRSQVNVPLVISNQAEDIDCSMRPSSVCAPYIKEIPEAVSATECASAGVGVSTTSPQFAALKLLPAHVSIFYGEESDFMACRLCRVQGFRIFQAKPDSRQSMEKHLIEEHRDELETLCDLTDEDFLTLQTEMR